MVCKLGVVYNEAKDIFGGDDAANAREPGIVTRYSGRRWSGGSGPILELGLCSSPVLGSSYTVDLAPSCRVDVVASTSYGGRA